MTLAHCHPSWSDLRSLRLSIVLQGRLLLAQVGHWAQARCLLPELRLEPLPCQLGKPGPPRRSWQRQQWCQCRAGWGGSASHSACRFASTPFPFRTLNSVEQGSSVDVGQTPALCGDLCLSGVPRVSAQFLQIFYQFVRILHLFRGEFKKHWGCPLP